MRKAVIHWEVDGRTGHGEPISVGYAVAWVNELNEKHGAGTHWYVLVEGGTE